MTKPSVPLIILFTSLVLLDLVLIGAILIHGKANFVELYKHLSV
jgi:hypothetical protein